MRNYELNTSKCKRILSDWLHVTNNSTFVQDLDWASTHQDYKDFAMIIICSIQSEPIRQKIIIRFKKLNLI